MSNLIKFILAILLLLCLAKLPYGYFQLVRFIALIGFMYLTYQRKQQEKQSEMLIYIVLALLFQPFFKVALGRELWNVVDVIVAIFLLISIYTSSNKTGERNNDNLESNNNHDKIF